MGSTVCSNDLCAATTSHDWKNGWPLRSGGFSTLCYNCGYDYEKFVFCEKYHPDQTGWRECTSCGKKLHCGCIASKSFIEFLDHGGVGCFNCINCSPTYTMNNQVPKELSSFVGLGGPQSTTVPNRVVSDSLDEGRLIQLCQIMEANEPNHIPRLHQPEHEPLSQGQPKKLEIMPRMGEVGRDFSSLGSMVFPKAEDANRTAIGFKDTNHDSLSEPSLKMTLGTPSRALDFANGLSNEVGDVKELNKRPSSASFNPYQNRPILPKPLKSGLGLIAEPNKGSVSPMRIARPPGEGRGRNQLLPRYWPRITDQELEKLSGDLNSAIVPLFEKVLSASDAGRIGRLVLPKACAEAYFPAISQSEGVPLRVQDVKANEWTFQFRFWPNNNSRMYVLEGVTPCIQAMQLQAGDTVTFSRIDPGGKLVMGFRKASNNGDIQEAEMPASPNGTNPESAIAPTENLGGTGNGYSGLMQSALFSEHLHLANGDAGLPKSSEPGGFRKTEDFLQKPLVNLEKKKTRNIGSKSKRLHMHSEDVLELRLTWEEAQDLLRPPPGGQPTVVTVEDHEFEEYEEPPVFGKRTLFVSRSPGAQEQWAQCDECSKWRRLPLDVLLPPKWTCSDNEWDVTRGSCSAPDEISLRQLENLVRTTRDLKKRRISESLKRRPLPSGLDALASAAAMGDRAGGEGSSGATTRHPRHRPGCSCIVCIQPPSGKGKHKPTCTCNVCMTVKRRFKTLMLRKNKRLSDSPGPAEIPEANGNGHAPPPIDLNSHPSREDDEVETEETKPTSEPGGYIDHQQPSGAVANADGGSQLGLESLNNSINNGVFVDPSLDRNKNS